MQQDNQAGNEQGDSAEKRLRKPRIRPKTTGQTGQSTSSAAPATNGSSVSAEKSRAAQNNFPLTTAQIPSMPLVQFEPAKLRTIQENYVDQLSKMMVSKPEMLAVAAQDRRFNNPTWLDSFFAPLAAMYVLNAKAMNDMTDAVVTDAKTHARLKFLTQQWIDAVSPTNFFATNPEVHQKIVESKGESLRSGISNLVADMQKGRISQTDEEAFEIGRNIATTAGDVVFQNEFFQLIQYKPTTEQVGSVPILMVPPSINKYYIMDLQPQTSFVKFTVDQGHTVFLMSWRVITEKDSKLTWDEFIEKGIIKAIDVVSEITGQPKINILGFCVGGTMTATALAVLAARKQEKINSFSLLTTLLDFESTGVLDVFIDEQHVRMREEQLGKGGLLNGSELASTFSFLRPNDLVWNYVVNNYLKGEKPVAFDLLYWNSDSTNLPGPFFVWYLRNMYLENNLVKRNKLTVCGEKMDLSSITAPTYSIGAREDHIVPWDSAWKSLTALGGPKRYVLGASGHIAGSMNPASKNKRSYWVNDEMGKSAQAWLDGATEMPGSWWNDWAQWLKSFMGEIVAAPALPGSDKYRPVESAPGSYVKVRISESKKQ